MSTLWLINETSNVLVISMSQTDLALDTIRKKVIYQNTIDTWIAVCYEKDIDWYEIENYKKFVSYLLEHDIKMKKFPLCIKESGGMYERGKDKTKFAEDLSQLTEENAAAYTIKLSDDVVNTIRNFIV